MTAIHCKDFAAATTLIEGRWGGPFDVASIIIVKIATTRHAVADVGNGVIDGGDCSVGDAKPSLLSWLLSMSSIYTKSDEPVKETPAPMSQLVGGKGNSTAADAAATSRVRIKCGGFVIVKTL